MFQRVAMTMWSATGRDRSSPTPERVGQHMNIMIREFGEILLKSIKKLALSSNCLTIKNVIKPVSKVCCAVKTKII